MAETVSLETHGTSSRKPGGRGINGFLHAVKSLVETNPLLSILSGIVLFLVGWFGNLALDTAYRTVFPDQGLIRAQVLREQINAKTDTIGEKLAVMEANLSNVGDDGAEAKAFLAAAETVMRELQGLRPEISQLASDADRYTERLASAKASELASTGQSAQADFVLPYNGSMTLCPSRFTFATTRSNIQNHVGMTLSHEGENNGGSFTPGQSIRLDGPDGAVSVGYLGPVPGEELYRFNFTCIDG
ncbi:hypothetical protein A3731_09510 [Roseovarius sp. HI0049]|nr:hypothetical protein A3731_09510 [Roseovarius sp. HI0049]